MTATSTLITLSTVPMFFFISAKLSSKYTINPIPLQLPWQQLYHRQLQL